MFKNQEEEARGCSIGIVREVGNYLEERSWCHENLWEGSQIKWCWYSTLRRSVTGHKVCLSYDHFIWWYRKANPLWQRTDCLPGTRNWG